MKKNVILPLAIVFGVLLIGIVAAANYPVPKQTPIATTKPLAAADVDLSKLVELTNQDRAQSGLPALAEDTKLDQTAQAKCNDMVANNYYAHVSPSGVQWSDFIKAQYPHYSLASENLNVVWGAASADAVEQSWMNSPEHKANILNGQFQYIGFGECLGTYQSKPAVYVVEDFLKPYVAPATSKPSCMQPEVSRNRYSCADARTYPPCINGENPYDGSLYCI